MAVEAIHIRNALMFPLVNAEYDKTILIELMSKTNVLTDVTGMLNTSEGSGPVMLFP